MRDELLKGNRSIFSYTLYDELKKNLENKKQSILFLNRRGFSTFISCRSCGYVVKCDNCDIAMTYHKNINKLRCHYCGVTMEPPILCPKCKSKYIKYFGIGTEKVEEQVREYFPEARIVRMDSDTTALKGSFENILEDMKNNKIDILIGTQMISKGLDFPNVTLVGVVAADTTLNLPDFRSPEKAFQLITQVAGRAGRGDSTGKVVIQTYNPNHYSILYSKEQDYNSFYDTEINLRKEFLYPPFINIISILVYGDNLCSVKKKIMDLYDIIKTYMLGIHKEKIKDYLIGPNPAPIEKIKNNYRWQILIKFEDKDMEELKALINRVCILDEYKLKDGEIKFSIDINPHTIL
jgi:primosomal protein N' (replication factor Y)